MGTLTGQVLADQVETLLQDETNVRWTEPELTDWLNAAQREIVGMNPSAKTANESLTMTVGTRQSLPDSGVQLIDVVRNMGADGATPGRAVRSIERKVLDEQRPDWHAETAASEAMHFTHDARDPRSFYVYPPNDGNGTAEVVYSAGPSDLADLTDTIDLDDIYGNALVNYAVYRALSKDADYTANSQMADYYFKTFQGFVAHRAKIDGNADPGASEDAMTQPRQAAPRG